MRELGAGGAVELSREDEMFDLALDAPRRSGALAASALLHGLLASTVVVGSFWSTHDPPEPPEKMLAFLRPIRVDEPIAAKLVEIPKGAPLGGGPRRPAARAASPPLEQPRDIPGAMPNAPAAEPDAEIAEGRSGAPAADAGPGFVDGPLGVPDGSVGGEIRPANAPDVTPPVPLVTTRPVYPDVALRLRRQGVVILEAIIGADGEVRSARVLRSAGAILDAAAEKAVLGWRYRPARVGARPVSVYLTVTVTFGIA